jgi:hypothetical protein
MCVAYVLVCSTSISMAVLSISATAMGMSGCGCVMYFSGSGNNSRITSLGWWSTLMDDNITTIGGCYRTVGVIASVMVKDCS